MDSAMNRLMLLALGLLVTMTSSGCYHYCRHKHGCSSGWQPGGCGAEDSCGAALAPRQARLQHHRPRGRDEMCADDFAECNDCGRRHRRRDDDCGLCDDCVRQSPRDRRTARRAARRPGRGCDACGGACTSACGGEMSCGPAMGCSGPVSYGTMSGCSSCSGGYPAMGSAGDLGEGGWQPSSMGGAPMYGETISSPPSSGCSGCAGGGASSYPQGAMMMGSPMMQGGYVQGGYVQGGYVQGGYVQGGSIPSGMPIEGSNSWHSASMPSGPITSGPITSEPLGAPAAGSPVYSAPATSVPPPGTFPTPAK